MIGDKVAVFIDNCTLYGIMKNHIKHLREPLQTYREANLFLNLEKCLFLVPFGNSLGHIVSKEGLLADPTEVFGILHFLLIVTWK